MEDIMMMQSTVGRAAETLFKGVNILGRGMMIVGCMLTVFYFFENRKKMKTGIKILVLGMLIRLILAITLFKIDFDTSPSTDRIIWIIYTIAYIMFLIFSKKSDKKKDPESGNIQIEECHTMTDISDSRITAKTTENGR